MEKKTKNAILFIGSLLVAIMFITSYAASSNNNNAITTTVKPKSTSGYFASGYANAIVTDYSPTVLIAVKPSAANSIMPALSDYLSALEANGTIEQYVPENNAFLVEQNSSSYAYALQSDLYSRFQNNITLNTSVYLQLPKYAKLTVGTYTYEALMGNSTYALHITPLPKLNSTVYVKINTLVSANGTVMPSSTQIYAVK
ncbi:hypothetical protein M1373_03735 [Candidatus Marsarchaeota archaeon]|nr:hypothetical protein [Candidatus Marsarchaeota archaeon]MCL5405031.1 hypothetical protein [Candidatus Marsarchaeota archaeon]